MRIKKEEGITLIALAIIIIVLLILAGITITSLMSDNGILKQSKTSASQYKMEEYREELTLKLLEAQLDVMNTKLPTDSNYLSELRTNLRKKIEKTNKYKDLVEGTTDDVLFESVTTKKEGYKYKITSSEVTYIQDTGEYLTNAGNNGTNSDSEVETEVYTITYIANGGEGTMGNDTLFANDSITLKTNTFTNSGYSFNGWKDQNNNSYNDGATITPTGNLTLTAQWNLITYLATIKLTGKVCYGKSGAANYDSTESNSISSISIKVFYTKNGIQSIQNTSYVGPTFKDWWRTDIKYYIGWRLYNATVTKDNNVMNKNIQIPISITGALGYGSSGKSTINASQSSYTWNTTIDISSNNTVSLSSTDSLPHR